MNNINQSLDCLEQYLQSKDKGYYIPDSYSESSKMIVIEAYPTAFDISESTSCSAFKTAGGMELFDNADPMPDIVKENMDSIGVMYLSNVPLFPMEGTWDMAGAMEAVRLASKPASEYLRAYFAERFTRLIMNDKVKLIAYKLDLVKRYYDDFVEHLSENIRTRLADRLADGSLKIIAFPNYKKSYLTRNIEIYDNFKTALSETFLP